MAKLLPLPLDAWPPTDRRAWEKLFTPREGLFGKSGAGLELRPATRTLYERGYGIWLAHLAATGALDQGEPATARATPPRLDAWIVAMHTAGRIDSVVRLYLTVLHAVLRLFDPLAEVSFIIKPNGTPLSRLLPSEPKSFPPFDTEDVMRRVRDLHAMAGSAPTAFARRTSLRDAALLALLLRRAPRVASIAAMRLGSHLQELPDGRYLCRFEGEDTKSGRRLAWPLDAECSAMMRDYLRDGRPLFEQKVATDALWLGNHGTALDDVGIAALFRRRMRELLSCDTGPHTARKWLRSSAARRSPEAAFDAAEVLDHSPQVSVRHYADAREIGACQRHADHIRALRKRTRRLAERSFGALDAGTGLGLDSRRRGRFGQAKGG